MTKLHSGLCGGHLATKTQTYKILGVGYYWLTVFADVHKFFRAFKPCQLFIGRKHLEIFPFHPMVVEAPLKQRGLDFIKQAYWRILVDG